MEEQFYDILASRPDILVAVGVSSFVFFEPTIFEKFIVEIDFTDERDYFKFVCKYFCKIKFFIYLFPLLLSLLEKPIYILALLAFLYISPFFPEWVFYVIGLLAAAYFIANSLDSRLFVLVCIVIFIFINYNKIVDKHTCIFSTILKDKCTNYTYKYLAFDYHALSNST